MPSIASHGLPSYYVQTYQAWEDVQYGVLDSEHTVFTDLIDPLSSSFEGLASDFKFYPTFAVIGLMGFFVKRWRNFIFAAWSVEGRIKDISIIVGAAVINPDDPRTREWLFTYYRHVVAVMALQYKAILGDFDAANPYPKLLELGIVTEAEAKILEVAGSRARDTVTTWLAALPMQASDDGILTSKHLPIEILVEKIADMRASMMFFQCVCRACRARVCNNRLASLPQTTNALQPHC